MAVKTIFVCTNCGAESSKWYGRCPECGEWNTFQELTTEISKKGKKNSKSDAVTNTISLFDAFADSEKGMAVCSCRLLTNNILFEIEDLNHDYILTKDKNYYYFWWQCKNELEKKNYVKKYKKIKKEYEEKKQELENRKFEDICSLTKEYSNATE